MEGNLTGTIHADADADQKDARLIIRSLEEKVGRVIVNGYPTGVKVSEAELAAVRLEPAAFHGEWNYTIRPTSPSIDTFIA